MADLLHLATNDTVHWIATAAGSGCLWHDSRIVFRPENDDDALNLVKYCRGVWEITLQRQCIHPCRPSQCDQCKSRSGD